MVTSSGEKCLLLSVAVRAGYVLLWSFVFKRYMQKIHIYQYFLVPLLSNTSVASLLYDLFSGGSDDPKLITTIKLSCDTHWPNMMKWDSFKWGGCDCSSPATKVVVFVLSISLGHTLTIGYTNGKVDCLYWEPTESLTPTWFMSPHPLTTLWSHEDEIVVDLLVWTDKVCLSSFV